MINILSIDVEEYFHANNIQKVVPISSWESLPSRVVDSTKIILDLLEKKSIKATFFILGYVAKKHPNLVKEIASLGHEIASHGFMHQLVYEQTPDQFFEDIHSSKLLLEEIIGKPVIGYRAPSFSITDKSPWAYSQLCKAGYKYDSSRYPIWHPRYNNLGQSTEPETIKTENGEIIIYPLATASLEIFGKKIPCPIAGGAYWRLLPFSYIKWGMKKASSTFNVYYIHPWEFDFEQPRFDQLSKITQYRHHGGSKNFIKRLDIISDMFSFKSFSQVM